MAPPLAIAGCVLALLIVHGGADRDAAAAPAAVAAPTFARADPPAARALAVRPVTLPARLRARTVVLPILMYHRIAVGPSYPEITRRLTVSPHDFARHMTWLSRHGYRGVTQRELLDAVSAGTALPRRAVLVTFDDGYRNVLTHAAPVLARLGMPATAFVITDRISAGDPSFLTWRQLRALEELGVEVASHTRTHRDLTTLPARHARGELCGSRARLESALGHPVQSLAYPFGGHDSRTVALARSCGYVIAMTTNFGTRQQLARPLELRRISIVNGTSVRDLAAVLRAP